MVCDLFVLQVAVAVDEYVTKGLYHPDMKPEHVLLQTITEDVKYVRFIDLAQARKIKADEDPEKLAQDMKSKLSLI